MAPDVPDKRRAILDAALALFGERGFHGTAVPLVAARAGVGAGTLYRYFASKELLVNALYQEHKEALGRALLDGFPVGAAPRAQFSACWRRLARFAVDHAQAFAFLELHHHAPYLDAVSLEMNERVLGPLLVVVRGAQASGALKPLRPEILLAVVYGALVGIVRLAQAGHLPPGELEASLEMGERCAWDAIAI